MNLISSKSSSNFRFRLSGRSIFMLALALFVSACGEKTVETPGKTGSVFSPIDTSFSSQTLIVPKDFQAHLLFSEGDPVKAEWRNELGKAKGSHDFLAYLPIDGASDHGILWTNHETKSVSDVLGDGGGATVMEIFRDTTGVWRQVGYPFAIDFSGVGGTLNNCLGGVTPWGTVVTSEEVEPPNNRYLHRDAQHVRVRDTSDYVMPDTNGVRKIPRWKNFGWLVEVDVKTRKAIAKHYSMGRFMHEGNFFMADERTAYLLDDEAPGAFFKFVADRPRDLSEGTLFAFHQSEDGNSGDWMPLGRSLDTLTYARKYAFKDSATIFIRMEDLVLLSDGTFIISETGLDSTDFNQAIAWGGRPAKHHKKSLTEDGICDDKLGRLLRFDPKTNRISVFLESGVGKDDPTIHLSNPDNLALDKKRNMLVIHEDLVGIDAGRMPEHAQDRVVNEIYVLDLNKPNPSIDQLQRLAIAPLGAETTGGTWTPDFMTFFLNLQHPDETNPAPYNKASTWAITGWK
jgi:hypothetical protein